MRAKLFVVLGIALLTDAAVQAVAVRRYLRDTSVTIGEVMATPYGGSHPVIRFATADGVVVTFHGPCESGQFGSRRGRRKRDMEMRAGEGTNAIT